VAYTPTGQQQSTTDPLGHTTYYYYDALNRLIQTVYPDGTSTSSSYDANGNRTNSVDQLYRTNSYVYDALYRLTNTIYADLSTSRTIYDGVGRVQYTVDALGYTTAFGYDAAGERIAVTNASGTSVAQTNLSGFDLNGNQITSTDSLDRVTTNVYDALNRQVEVLYADGTKTSTGYDADGRKVAATNQDTIVTWFAYDGAGRLTAVTNALTNVTSYAYDQAGNQTNQIDALGRQTAYAFDGMGRRVSRTLPGSQTERMSYDLAGNLAHYTNFNGAVITNQYDALNRLTRRSGANGYMISFSDTATGQRASMVDMSGTSSYLYDIRDRLTTKAVSFLNGPTLTNNYTYDLNGNLTSLWTDSPGGATATYQYDALNRLTNVLGQAIYGYDGVGNLQSLRESALTNLYQYDVENRLTNLVWGWSGNSSHTAYTIASFYYQLGATGNRTHLVEMLTSPSSTINNTYVWSYDPLYRLTNENISGSGTYSYQYTYDAVGNRTSRTATNGGLGNQSFSFNTNDWLNTDTYDSSGNTVTNGSNQPYRYDLENHLTNFNNSVYLGYNGDGLRVVKTASGTNTFYLVDDRNPTGYPQVLEEWTASGGATNLSKTYTYGLSLLTDSVGYLYGQDGHGSTRFLIGALGSVVENYTYDAYGNIINSYGTSTTTRLYCGEEWDPDLGFYYLRSRYMNPNTGRFWTMDLFEGSQIFPISLHKYLYCEVNPICLTDPSGRIATISDWFYGRFVERAIAADYLLRGPAGFKPPPLYTPISTILGVPYIPCMTAGRPDLVLMPGVAGSPGQVWEIKPAGSFVEGTAQLWYYIAILNYFDRSHKWVPGGENYTPPNVIPISWGVVAHVAPPIGGVILYNIEDIRMEILTLVVVGSHAAAAEFELEIGLEFTLEALEL
jgi:RHS repeat-associated protein